jgi:hypothetical protein
LKHRQGIFFLIKRAEPRFLLEEIIIFVYIHNAAKETTGAAAQKRKKKKSEQAANSKPTIRPSIMTEYLNKRKKE